MKKTVMILVLVTILVGIAGATDFSTFSFLTWLFGAGVQQPKNFERSEGAYTMLKLHPPQELSRKFGSTILVDPTSRLGQWNESGAKLFTLSDNGWVTDIDISFHKDRDRQASDASVEIEFASVLESNGNVKKKMLLWKENFSDSNGAEIRVFPPKVVEPSSKDDWDATIEKMEKTGEPIVLTVNTYVNKPVRMKASQSIQVVLCPTWTLATRMGYRANGLGVVMLDAQNRDKDFQRQNGKYLRVRLKNLTSANIALFDSLGEVYRGQVTDGQEFKVLPGEKTAAVRITQLEGQNLSMNPPSKDGFIQVGESAEVLIYPAGEQIAVGEAKILRGQVKVYGSVGSRYPVTLTCEGEKSTTAVCRIDKFGGKVFNVWTDSPKSELRVKVAGVEKPITSNCDQVIFDFESRQSIAKYSRINVNPAVRGGINSIEQLRVYANTSHFLANLTATGVDKNEIDKFYQLAKSGQIGYLILGPDVREIVDNGSRFTTTNMVKSLTECGPGGQPIGHKTFYRTTFSGYHRVWVPKGRYGWVPGIISTCGNAVMVWVAPPNIPKIASTPLPTAPAPDEPMRIGFDELVITTAGIRQGNLVITPSSISPYIPQAKIDIKQSQSQHQGQTQSSVNSNVNTNTNINTTNVDVTNNNINQNLNINNNANALGN